LKKHKFNIFPEMNEDDKQRLVNDLSQNGYDQKQPIYTYQGGILDGWNRWVACSGLGISPAIREFTGSDSEALDFVMRTNKRRNLNSSQWAMIAVEAEDIMRVIAEAVERERLAKQKENAANQYSEPLGNKLPKANYDDTKAATKAAGLFNTNRTYIHEAAKLKAEAPELAKKVFDGEITVPQAKREIKEKQREERRQENQSKIDLVKAPELIVESGARFATIVIDPPWDWGDEGDCDQLGRAKPDYSTMSIDEIQNLPIQKLADTDCHIYLWITNRSLPKGFRLLDAWGFRYITALTWVKPSFGMGNYFRGQTEHVLFGVKGSQPLKRKDVGTVFTASRGRGHSGKPSEFYDLIESCSPGPYIDMFSRQERDNWAAWGENG
jgi:N6-adenosine-specific RNA methylase IME4